MEPDDFTKPVFHTLGMPVYISPDRPKMQLSEDCPVTPDFRVYINKWLLEFFGVENSVPDGQALVNKEQNAIYMNARTYQCAITEVKRIDEERLPYSMGYKASHNWLSDLAESSIGAQGAKLL